MIHTAWCSNVVVAEVLLSINVSKRSFYGVRALIINEEFLEWLTVENLLWVFEDGGKLKVGQDYQSRPRINEAEANFGVEGIIGQYFSSAGNAFVGVKWEGYQCPTWELEDEVSPYIKLKDQIICAL
jgi:hypothetical protein